MLAITGSLLLASLALVVLVVRSRSRAAEPTPKPAPVVLRYESGTTVTLDGAASQSAQNRLARGSIAPAARRRLPGLMPTAGHAAIPSDEPAARRVVPPKSMDFDDS